MDPNHGVGKGRVFQTDSHPGKETLQSSEMERIRRNETVTRTKRARRNESNCHPAKRNAFAELSPERNAFAEYRPTKRNTVIQPNERKKTLTNETNMSPTKCCQTKICAETKRVTRTKRCRPTKNCRRNETNESSFMILEAQYNLFYNSHGLVPCCTGAIRVNGSTAERT